MRDNGQRIEREIQYLDPKNEQLPINKHGIADTGTVFLLLDELILCSRFIDNIKYLRHFHLAT